MRSAKNGRPAVFLDRDGTINVEKEYLYKPEGLELIPGSATAIREFHQQGYLVIVITNQAGVARGFYTEEDIHVFHKHFDKTLVRFHAKIDGYYYCPHHPDFGDKLKCDCRKPAPGLILRAADDFNIDLSLSYLIGDKTIDIEAANAAGVTPVMVATGYGAEQRKDAPPGAHFANDLMDCLKITKPRF